MLTILGSSAALPLYKRHNASQVLRMGKRLIMIDCGDGTQYQCTRYGVSLHKLDMLLISHLHGDHYFGIFALLNNMQMVGRTQKFYIFAPPDLADLLRLQFKVSNSHFKFEIVFKGLPTDSTEVFFEDDTITIATLPLDHRITPCNGFLIREKVKPVKIKPHSLPPDLAGTVYISLKNGQDIYDEAGKLLYRAEDYVFIPPSFSYAYCSDTAYAPSLVPLIMGVDILYHEATFMQADAGRATETYHSTTEQAGQIALDAGVGKLIIGHISAKYSDYEPLLQETREIFANTYFAVEGETFAFEKLD
jgi:ribonuclease Z